MMVWFLIAKNFRAQTMNFVQQKQDNIKSATWFQVSRYVLNMKDISKI